MRFSNSFIEKVKEANNIVDIISSHSELKRAGNQLTGLCPYPNHQEKTPSFSVSDQKQVYYCFGCKQSGNIFNFLEDIKGLNFVESVEYLANRASIPMPKEDIPDHVVKKQDQQVRLKKNLKKLNHFVAEFYHSYLKQLPSDSREKMYVAKRGMNPGAINTFKIGYSSKEWQSLTNHLIKNKVPLAWAEELGLIKKKNKPSGNAPEYFDILRDRIIYPIYSHKDECIGFGGRIIDEGQPKYLNSPESSLFSKGQIFYGLNESAKYIRSEDQVLVVEGYMDYLALYQSGIKNIVATLGTALTEHHAKLLKRYSKNVVVLFDGDQAGQNAAKRSLPFLLEAELYPKALTLPDGQDPDDFVKANGAEALKKSIHSAPELFEVILNRAFTNYTGSASDKIKIVDEMAQYIHCAKDLRLKNLYFEELQERLQVKAIWLKNAIGSPQKAKPSFQQNSTNPDNQEKSPDSNELKLVSLLKTPPTELYFINLCLMNQDFLEEALDTQISGHFSHPGAKFILQKALDLHGQFPSKFDNLTTLLMPHVKENHLLSKQFDNELENLNSEERIKLFKDCTNKIKQAHLKIQAKNIALNLKGKSNSEQLKELEQFMNIQKHKIELDRN
ncbi:MAG: DNA primase [Bdellovibrionaceae bacterium]|jgi:DNA primase|nr:DNA primase [Pseudobdellovibrionaceae bacterium]